MALYQISREDFDKLESDLHKEVSKMLNRYILIKNEPAPDPVETADQAAPVPEKKKRGRKPKEKIPYVPGEENITIAGQEKRKRGRPAKKKD